LFQIYGKYNIFQTTNQIGFLLFKLSTISKVVQDFAISMLVADTGKFHKPHQTISLKIYDDHLMVGGWSTQQQKGVDPPKNGRHWGLAVDRW
jgi:hypothetical protein